jgi:hypothetical protein
LVREKRTHKAGEKDETVICKEKVNTLNKEDIWEFIKKTKNILRQKQWKLHLGLSKRVWQAAESLKKR